MKAYYASLALQFPYVEGSNFSKSSQNNGQSFAKIINFGIFVREYHEKR